MTISALYLPKFIASDEQCIGLQIIYAGDYVFVSSEYIIHLGVEFRSCNVVNRDDVLVT